MAGEVMSLSHRELDRAQVIRSVVEGSMRQGEAARRLGLSVRQVKRLVRRFRAEGPVGLASRQRGRSSNRRIADAIRTEALRLAKEVYPGFNVSHLHELLGERHDLRCSRETLRSWLVDAGLHQPGRRRRFRSHPGRPRRPARGELIQIDGSDHDWFEGRGPRCTLIVFIDDATGCLMGLRFVPAETTRAYLHVLREYLGEHGRPVALYSDRHSIFCNSLPGCEGQATQFARALETLEIESIQAYTPQAKGRVERANQTLQDRLIKEMRLLGISDIDAANDFLSDYRERFNGRFGVTPASEIDAHRPLRHTPEELELILSIHHQRTATKDLVVRFQNARLQIEAPRLKRRLQRARIAICEPLDGSLRLFWHDQELDYRILGLGERPHRLADEKSIHEHVERALEAQTEARPTKPPLDHPWRKPILRSAQPR